MAKKCGKCDPHEICEECPEWIFTLADLIMCMMGLFVLLWVLKPSGGGGAGAAAAAEKAAQEAAMTKVLAAIRESFGAIPNPNSTDPIDIEMMRRSNSMGIPRGPGEGGDTTNRKEGAEGTDQAVTTIRTGKTTTEGGRVLFKRGDYSLNEEAKNECNQIAKIIRGHTQVVLIKGHASLDDSDERGKQALMELSIKRAQTVRDYLESLGVSPNTMRVVGCGTYEPVHQRAYSSDAQKENRRVEVEGTSTTVSELQDPAQTTKVKSISPE